MPCSPCKLRRVSAVCMYVCVEMCVCMCVQRCGIKVTVLEAGEAPCGYCIPAEQPKEPPPCDLTPLPLLPPPLAPRLAQPLDAAVGADAASRAVRCLQLLAAQQGLSETLQGAGTISGQGSLLALQQVPILDPATSMWIQHDVQAEATRYV